MLDKLVVEVWAVGFVVIALRWAAVDAPRIHVPLGVGVVGEPFRPVAGCQDVA